MLKPVAGLFEIRGEVPGQLRGLGASRVTGYAKQVDTAGTVFDDECHAQASQKHRAGDVHEVDRQDRLGLGAKERVPPVISRVGWWNVVGTQDLADRTGADAMTQTAQLSLVLTTPRRRFSVARRTISVTTSSA